MIKSLFFLKSGKAAGSDYDFMMYVVQYVIATTYGAAQKSLEKSS